MAAAHERIAVDLKAALKSGAKQRLGVLRMLKADLDKQRIDAGGSLSDADEVAVIKRAHKQRLEAAQMLAENDAQQDADRERAEASIVEEYLPQQLDEASVDKHIADAIASAGAQTPADMGKVMGLLKPILSGQADMKAVVAKVRERLAA